MNGRLIGATAALLFLGACGSGGDDKSPDGFNACGGDPIGGWDLQTAALEPASASDCAGGVSGFIFFNDNGRYSLSLDIQRWPKAGSQTCGFTAAYGGFYRVDGSKVCLGDSAQEGAAIPCDGTRPTTQHAVIDFCRNNNTLTMRSDQFLDPPGPTVLTLNARP